MEIVILSKASSAAYIVEQQSSGLMPLSLLHGGSRPDAQPKTPFWSHFPNQPHDPSPRTVDESLERTIGEAGSLATLQTTAAPEVPQNSLLS